MRKLVSIRKIHKIEQIPYYPALSEYHVDGWTIVDQSCKYKEGELVVFFEPDTALPVDPRFEFLPVVDVDGEKRHLITVQKIRGKYSQGIILPLEMFPEIRNPCEGMPVADIIGAEKYEPSNIANTSYVKKGDFPAFLIKSDQPRIQDFPQYFTEFYDSEFEETEKIDGTSVTIYLHRGEFGICAREYEVNIPESPKYIGVMVASKINLEKAMRQVGDNFAVQCEGIGPNIQVKLYPYPYSTLFVYDIIDTTTVKKLPPAERMEIYNNLFGTLQKINTKKVAKYFGHVPVLRPSVKIFHECPTIEKLLSHADGQSVITNAPREGLVYKGVNVPISFKAISNKYLVEVIYPRADAKKNKNTHIS